MANYTMEDGKIFLPPKDKNKPNEREVFHPETNGDQVLMSADGTTLNEYLGPQIIISEQKPSRPCIWLQPTSTRV